MKKYFKKINSVTIAIAVIAVSILGVFSLNGIDLAAAKNEITLPGGPGYDEYIVGKDSPKSGGYAQGNKFKKSIAYPQGSYYSDASNYGWSEITVNYMKQLNIPGETPIITNQILTTDSLASDYIQMTTRKFGDDLGLIQYNNIMDSNQRWLWWEQIEGTQMFSNRGHIGVVNPNTGEISYTGKQIVNNETPDNPGLEFPANKRFANWITLTTANRINAHAYKVDDNYNVIESKSLYNPNPVHNGDQVNNYTKSYELKNGNKIVDFSEQKAGHQHENSTLLYDSNYDYIKTIFDKTGIVYLTELPSGNSIVSVNSKIYELDMNGNVVKEKDYSGSKTTFTASFIPEIVEIGAEFYFTGYSEPRDSFAGYSTKPGVYVAAFDENLNVINASFIDEEIPHSIQTLQEKKHSNGKTQILVAGGTEKLNGKNPTLFTPPGEGYKSANASFFGTFESITDASPKLPEIKGWNVRLKDSMTANKLDEAMLSAIKSHMSNGGNNIEQNPLDDYTKNIDIYNRVNKNILNPNYNDTNIDWTKFGVSKSADPISGKQVYTTGPHKEVTYFTTDMSMNETVTSGLVNILDEETVTDKDNDLDNAKYALRANNYRVKKNTPNITSRADVITRAGVKAWNLTNGNEETSSTSKVKIDTSKIKADTVGVYPTEITYTSGGITVKKTIFVSIYDDNTNSGPEDKTDTTPGNLKNTEMLYAESKTLTVNQAKGKSIHEITGVKAWNVETGTGLNPSSAIDKPYNSASPAPGTYTIDYSTTRGTERTVKVKIEQGKIPKLVVNPTVVELEVGAAAPNLMTGVTATDTTSGDLNSKVKTSGTVNTARKGVYKIAYNVINDDGNEAEATRSYVVGANAKGTNYALFANNFKKHVTEVNVADEAILGSTGADAVAIDINAPTEEGTPIVTNKDGYTATPGAYKIDIAVNEEKTTKTQVIASVFKDGIVGNDIAIEAKNVTKRVSDAKDKAVLDLFKDEGMIAWDVHNGDDLTAKITQKSIAPNYNVSNPEAKNYEVTFSVEHAGKTQEITKTLTIIGGSGPLIKVEPTREVVPLHTQNLDLKQGVTATDVEDGNITNKINAVGTVNTSVEGVYYVEYTVEDSDGNIAKAKRQYIVGDDPMIGQTHVLFAHNFTKKLGEVNPQDVEQIKIDAGAKAFRLDNGDSAVVDIDDLGGYKAEVGPYSIVFKVSDEPAVKKGVIASVYNNGDPSKNEIIEMKSKTLRKSEAKGLSLHSITEATAWNKNTGLPVNVTVTSDPVYNPGNPEAKTYNATGKTNAGTTETATVKIENGEKPVIHVNQPRVELPLNAQLTPEVLEGVTVTDVEDNQAGLTITAQASHTNAQISTADKGVVIVEYNAIDSDGNLADSVTRTYVIGAQQVTGNYAIFGQDYSLRTGQVDLNDKEEQIKELGKLSAILLSDGQTKGTIKIENDDGYTNAEKVYNIAVTTKEDSTSKGSIKANIKNGQKPVITPTPTRVELNVGAAAPDLKQGVVAMDTEDGNITHKLESSGTVDVQTPGTYKINYSVTDSDGNTGTATRYYFVGAKKVGTNYALFGNDFSLRKGEVLTSDLDGQVRSKGNVFAQKISDGSPADVELVSLDGYTNQPADYYPEYKVKNEAATKEKIKVTVTDGLPPKITVNPNRIELALNAASPNLKVGVSATDAEDGDFDIDDIHATGNVDTQTPGVYVITYSVKDSDGNERTATRSYIVGADSVGIEYALFGTDFDILPSNVVISPESAKESHLLEKTKVKAIKISDGTLGNKPKLISDGGYSKTANSYTITYRAEEENVRATFSANVKTGDAPVITPTPSKVRLDLNGAAPNLLQGVTALDTEDGDITSKVEHDGTIVDMTQPGVYVVSYSVKDSDGNIGKAKRSYIVGANSVGETYAMFAVPHKLRVSEVDKTNKEAQIRQKTQVKAIRIADGLNMGAASFKLDTDDGYTNVAKDYKPVFSMIDEPATKIEVLMTVHKGKKPTIKANPAVVKLDLNEKNIYLKQGVIATDEEDGDFVPEKITASGAVNTNIPGTYVVKYSIKDSDGNEASVTRSYLVDAHVIGTDYAIYAEDFSILIQEVDITNKENQIREKSKIKAEKIVDGSDALLTLATDGGYDAVAKDYVAKFYVNNEPATKTDINITVTAGNKPDLKIVPDMIHLDLNSAAITDEDIRQGVTSIDAEDGNITDEITYTGTVDTTVEGVQIIKYTSTDKDGNIATGTRSYVIGGTLGENYVVYYNDFNIRKGQVDLLDLEGQFREKSNVRAEKIADGSSEEVVLDNMNGYTAAIGNYTAQFAVKSEQGTKIRPTANVITGEKPKIEFDNDYIELDLNAVKPTVDDLLIGASATDVEDGDLTNKLLVIEGEVDPTTRGIYIITYSVTDSDDNTTTATRSYIVDSNVIGNEYVIFGDDFIIRKGQVNVADKDGQIREKSNVEAFKIVDGETATITLETTDYDAEIGNYVATYFINEESQTKININIEVETGALPKITANPEIVVLSIGEEQTDETLRRGVEAVDLEDGDITDHITYTGAVDVSEPGTNVIKYSITDSDGNTQTVNRSYLVEPLAHTNDYALYGHSAVIRKGQVDETDVENQLKTITKIRGERVKDATEAPVTVTSTDNYRAELGTYYPEFAIDGETDPNIALEVEVVTGERPKLKVDPVTVVLTQGDEPTEEEILTGVTAMDDEDGDLTDKITYTGSIDTSKPGTSIITYKVIDSDDNIATITRSYLVDPTAYNDEYVMYGTDFELRRGQVDVNDLEGQIFTETGIYAERIATMEKAHVVLESDGGYIDEEGLYQLDFTLEEDQTLKLQLKANVVLGEKPLIIDETPQVGVELGDIVDVEEYIYATDTEDGDLTQHILISGDTVDTSTKGVYLVKYDVMDSDRNKADTVTRTYIVGGSYSAEYAIFADDFSILAKNVEKSDKQLIEKSNAKAVHLPTKEKRNVKVLNSNGYTNVEDIYTITFAVEDEETTIETIQATVYIHPYIVEVEGNDFSMYLSEFEQHVSAGTLDAHILEKSKAKGTYMDEDGELPLDVFVDTKQLKENVRVGTHNTSVYVSSEEVNGIIFGEDLENENQELENQGRSIKHQSQEKLTEDIHSPLVVTIVKDKDDSLPTTGEHTKEIITFGSILLAGGLFIVYFMFKNRKTEDEA